MGRSSILIVSENLDFQKSVNDALADGIDADVNNEASGFAEMNGKAAKVVQSHDFVIFEGNPEDETELEALSRIAKKGEGKPRFVAVTPEDAPLSVTRKMRAAGVSEVVPNSAGQRDLREFVDEALTARLLPVVTEGDGGSDEAATIIAVAQARGGAGSTTVAVNLAQALSEKSGSLFGRKVAPKVALVDFDVQFGAVGVYLDLEDNGALLQLLETGELPDTKFIESILQKHDSGVDVLVAPSPIAPLTALNPDVIAATLHVLQNEYDYVIVDLPRALVDWLTPVLKRASHMLIVSDLSVPCIRQARRLRDFMREDNVGIEFDVVINRSPKSRFGSGRKKEAESVLDLKLTHWLPEDIRAATKAVDLGRPVVTGAPRSPIAKTIRKLAGDIKKKHQHQHARV